jgi:stearoyl-CoA desaturase (delta-9 desaturase)
MLVYIQFLKIVGNHVAMHRYFTHRSFTTGPIREKFLALTSILLTTGSPVTWAMLHRHHHRYSDTDKDVHSPHSIGSINVLFGIWEYYKMDYFIQRGALTGCRDLMRNKFLMFLDRHYYKIWALLIITTLLISWKITIFFLLGPGGYIHFAGGIVNTIGHYNFPGSYRNHDTQDLSYNHPIWGIYSGGEGFHNNHHARQNSAYIGEKWFEIDISGIVIKLFFDDNYHLFKRQ